mmetsp:Transcript_91874/g.176873  ORF Transcript_91874/g.176873 Transcript_91874/m.176873 type:complete len:249 (+) Transcript_91874:70-816(+)|eukprot:CAMPEP_0172751054 /NCGR_PEP_ID=MMETSP1074-20121228/150792_1 /TAXON_ID=2916 /ORGANISM="Ceratium fusus, Strain PA161109" /LENGTH=248 /DNA_ID=CAMNT_0013583295 /DNA_START=66 /DNA_END=812 /DNA_ORIENTATION=+
MPLVDYTIVGGDVSVGVLKLDDGKMNSFSFHTIREVNAALDVAEGDATKALVIAGTAKALSAGFDLKIMAPVIGKPGGSKAEAIQLVEDGGALMLRIFGFPKPVIVAATGHALALGAIMLLAGDVRIAQRDAKLKVGLNETAIGMTMPEFGWCLAQFRLSPTAATRAVTQATIYSAVDAAAVGYLDELVEGDVLAAAVAEAQRLGSYVKQPAFSKTKAAERCSVLDRVRGNLRANVSACFPDMARAKL